MPTTYTSTGDSPLWDAAGSLGSIGATILNANRARDRRREDRASKAMDDLFYAVENHIPVDDAVITETIAAYAKFQPERARVQGDLIKKMRKSPATALNQLKGEAITSAIDMQDRFHSENVAGRVFGQGEQTFPEFYQKQPEKLQTQYRSARAQDEAAFPDSGISPKIQEDIDKQKQFEMTFRSLSTSEAESVAMAADPDDPTNRVTRMMGREGLIALQEGVRARPALEKAEQERQKKAQEEMIRFRNQASMQGYIDREEYDLKAGEKQEWQRQRKALIQEIWQGDRDRYQQYRIDYPEDENLYRRAARGGRGKELAEVAAPRPPAPKRRARDQIRMALGRYTKSQEVKELLKNVAPERKAEIRRSLISALREQIPLQDAIAALKQAAQEEGWWLGAS